MADGKATTRQGRLIALEKCYLKIANQKIAFNNLPDITDAKSATYNDEVIIGRSMPIKTFSHSDNRALSITLKFFVVEKSDIQRNLNYLRLVQSATYPRDAGGGAPYKPPVICQIKCGEWLKGQGPDGTLCCVIKDYSFHPSPDVPWDPETYLPYMFELSMNADIVYASSDLPGQERIMITGG
jgi:hypothetical protein